MSEIARRAALAAAAGVLVLAGVVLAATWPVGNHVAAASTDRWLSLTSSPLVRSEVAAARIGRRVFVVGGYDARGVTTNAVAAYDIRRNRWARPASMPIAVNHPTAAAYRGRLYVHGGFTVDRQTEATSALQRYEPETDRWRLLPASDHPRAAHALVARRGKLYAAAGANGRTGELTSLEVYDIARKRWRDGPDMSVGRNHVAGAKLGGRIYVMGGRPGNLDDVEVYDPRHRRWSRAAPLDTPRSGFTAAVVRGRIVAFGGEAASGTIAPAELYDPTADRWKALPAMLTPRHGLGGASRGRRVFAMEGGPRPGGHYSNVLEYLDIPDRLTR